MSINLHLLRIFYQVAIANSFTKAAEMLFISQSAVSKGVRELEKQLELPLIERGIAGTKANKGILFTEHGQALFEHARTIFSIEKAAVNDLKARLGLRRGQLTIGASTTIASYWLARYISSFQQQYPSVVLEIRVGNTEAMRQQLINCDVDLALVEGVIQDERINIKPWRQEELKIIAAYRQQVTIEDLQKQLWVTREQGSGTHTTTEQMLSLLNINPQSRLTLASNEGIARTVACGLGVSILPACTVQELIDLNSLKSLEHPQAHQLTRMLYLLTLKERPSSPLLKAFIQTLNQL